MKPDDSASKKSKANKAGNVYDRIFRENAEGIFIPLIEMQYGLQIEAFRPLKNKLTRTMEREVDFLYEVDLSSGDTFLLNIEFQTEDDPKMVYRVGEYHGMIQRTHKKEIRHIVIYLGTGQANMRTQLKDKEVYKGFDLINLHDLDAAVMLSSQIPSVVVLTLLSRYESDKAEAILRLVISRLKTICQNEHELRKYLTQLVILSRLRKLESITIKLVSEMPIVYDITQDDLYIQGIEKGIEKGMETAVRKLLIGGMSPKKIVTLLEVELKEVLRIQSEIKASE